MHMSGPNNMCCIISMSIRPPRLDPYDEVWGKSLRSANGWLRDRALRDWVSGQNVDEGIAPANHHVWQQHMASSGSDASGALRPVKCARWKRRRRDQWIQRWAKRCRVQQGAFKNGERLSVEALQTKVQNEQRATTKTYACAKKQVRKTCPENGPRIWPILLTSIEEGDRFPGLFF